jgi:type 1 glutamine amidotransferase
MSVNRRQMLFASGAALLGPTAVNALGARRYEHKKVLFFTKSNGFQHSAITRKGDELSHAERTLTALGKSHDFEVVCSKDGTLFEPDKIGQWDAFVFYTTGVLTQPDGGTDKQPSMTEKGLAAFIDAVKSGKAGFCGVHSATDTHALADDKGADDPYTALIGGRFNGHGAQQVAELIVADRKFPGAKELPETLKINDEWYSQQFQPKDLHAILVHDTSKMQGDDYKRPNYPQTWVRTHGKGRVFHTSMGHREDVWDNPLYQGLVMGGLLFATGQVDVDTTPNCQKVCPDYLTLEK